MKFISCAQWPDTISVGPYTNNVSYDIHNTKEAALVVCKRLMEEGFGGDRKIYPLKIWVEEK